jgi:hypothetical protein
MSGLEANYKRRRSGTEEEAKNIDFCNVKITSVIIFLEFCTNMYMVGVNWV